MLKRIAHSKRILLMVIMLVAALFSGCQSEPAQGEPIPSESAQTAEYRKITAKQAKEMMDSGESYILLDVRTEEEWTESRIDGSLLIPDYEISDCAGEELPDKSALILLYCRSGRRSADAANALVEMGYKNVYDFGGIIDWPYENVSGTPSETAPNGANELSVSFDYAKQSGYASNQFAVWIEDMDGNLVKTLYATRYTANGGYIGRPDSIPLWVEKSGLTSLSDEEVDAVSGATPKAGTLSYTWDLTDSDGNAAEQSGYKVFVEGSLRWKNRVVYSAVIDTSGSVSNFEAEYIYAESDGQPALNSASPENEMIQNVTAEWRQTYVLQKSNNRRWNHMSYKGGDRAEFGIIENMDYEKDYGGSYEPETYGCVAICDDALNDWWGGIAEMPSYFHCYNRLETALARWGITLIPPSSLELLLGVIKTKTNARFQADASEIITLLEDAKARGKFVIHYGIQPDLKNINTLEVDAAMIREHSFPPLINAQSRTLILGSLPGAEKLSAWRNALLLDG